MQNIEMVNNYNIHDYMSILDLSDQCLMTVSHPLRWISVLNFVFCGTLFVSLPPFCLSLYCLPFSDFRLLNIPLVSVNIFSTLSISTSIRYCHNANILVESKSSNERPI